MHARTAMALSLALSVSVSCSPTAAPADGASTDGAVTSGSLGPERDGIATFYDSSGVVNCGLDTADPRFAAINQPQWEGSGACGMCAQVTGPRGSITVRIVDRCPECSANHLDLNRAAFREIADESAGRVAIRWRPVPCDVSGPLAFHFKEGSSQWWVGIQVRNHRLPVRALEAQRDGAWVPINREDYNYFVAPGGLGPGPLTLRVTAVDGQQVVEPSVALRDRVVVQGTQQFR